jgi:hypothetical protein
MKKVVTRDAPRLSMVRLAREALSSLPTDLRVFVAKAACPPQGSAPRETEMMNQERSQQIKTVQSSFETRVDTVSK